MSLFGAQLAAALGLPYACASHYAPQQVMQAIALYRATFKPSGQINKPYVMLVSNVFDADTDEQVQLLATSIQQSLVNLRSGRPGKLRLPRLGYLESLELQEVSMLDKVLSCSAIVSPATVRPRGTYRAHRR